MANSEKRIRDNMTVQDVLITMSEGNPGALTTMMQMLNCDPNAFQNIMLFDSMGIYGSKIYMVWNDCCGRDMEKFKKTMNAFREGRFTEKEIHKNLSQGYAKPFI